MPEVSESVQEPVVQASESLGWRAGLPDDLKQNEALIPFKTVGEFAKSYLETSTKAKDLEGKIGNYVPKLPDNATDEDRNAYYAALGRPKTPSEYKLPGEDKNASEWNEWSHGLLYKAGLTQAQAELVGTGWNQMVQQIVEKHNASIQNEIKEADTKLRSEYGDKYETNVELAKRFYQNTLGTEFDKAFDAGTSVNRSDIIRLLIKVASKTGEDTSPQGGHDVKSEQSGRYDFSMLHLPPKRTA
jgi:hypothetical protein